MGFGLGGSGRGGMFVGGRRYGLDGEADAEGESDHEFDGRMG